MRVRTLVAIAVCLLLAAPAGAVLDIEDKGPVLDAGNFTMRVTNIGAVGNPFFDIGRSYDPSFEYPKGGGVEMLHSATLWVGAKLENGEAHVSGGPLLEWRPTLDPADHVYKALAGDPRANWNVDDDGDGRVDEEVLNGKDDDGDGKVDEDFAMSSDQLLGCDFADDRPEAVNYAYPNGEVHVPLDLDVHQDVLGWGQPASSGIAGLEFTVHNHGTHVLRDVRMGVLADLDVRDRGSAGGQIQNEIAMVPYHAEVPQGDVILFGYWKHCFFSVKGVAPAVRDGAHSQCITVVGLSHTTDPLGYIVNFAFPGARAAAAAARAPRRDTTFRYSIFANDMPPGQGGVPPLDALRYAAMAGDYPTAPPDQQHDYVVLLSCGPFSELDPGQSLKFSVALVAAPSLDSLPAAILRASLQRAGTGYNLQPDGPLGNPEVGATGINGHEICYEPPAGITFTYEPHCPGKFYDDQLLFVYPTDKHIPPLFPPPASESLYTHGHCVWSDLDCDACSGHDGTDRTRPWYLDFAIPPPPSTRVTAGVRSATIEWDNHPELTIAAGSTGAPAYEFSGYKLYRLDDWTRESLLPSPAQWQRVAVFRPDTTTGALSLASVTEPNVSPDGEEPGGEHFPVGRYRFVDTDLRDGFDYQYVVTTAIRTRPAGTLPAERYEIESPFTATFDTRIVPHAASAVRAGQAHVVPNPYRGSAPWERPSVPGDVQTRHIDFVGLPGVRSTVRIYTVAGDLVQTLSHDGGAGNGELAWDLISRNGQDVVSGVYLFTVDSSLGHQIGRFVIIR